ncbi:ABC transporter permease [Lewinella cohaerens]|uniref:ABC transporter permease n=1 Tax=Lewinella cohaerens TaxID=70995 RepID=UPI00035C6E97|nr:ABC transporter permease [Lewinella cohaerens]
MFHTYFKIAYRHLRNNKFFTLLNVMGLGVGMAVAIIIGIWIWEEVSFDKYHDKYERIACVMQNHTFEGVVETWWSQPKQSAAVLRDDYGSHFEAVVMTSFNNVNTLRKGENLLNKNGIFSEPGGPELLGLNVIHGTRSVLDNPDAILVSETTARNFFGVENAVGEVLNLNEENQVTIAGVYEDLPKNSSYADMDFMGSWLLYEQGLPEWVSWGNSWFQTLVEVKEGKTFAEVSTAIEKLKQERMSEAEGLRFKPELFLHPMSQWRLHSEFENGVSAGGRITYVRSFALIGFIVLLLACINFMNLSTARSEQRAREVGIRKTMGSRRGQLIGQFYSESLLLAFGGGLVGLVLVTVLLPFFSQLADKEMIVQWNSPFFWLLCAGFCVLTGLLAGSYPALYLSSFAPVNAMKGVMKKGAVNNRPREVLVVLQFTVSVVLIVGTIVVFQQINFAKNRPIGFSNEGLIGLNLRSPELDKRFDTFREDLLSTGFIEEVAKSEAPLTSTYVTNSGLSWPGKAEGFQDEFVTLRVSHEFGETMGWNIVEGRDFSREFATDSMGFVINKAAQEYMGLTDPIGQKIKWGEDETYTIVGVVEDMITQSPYTPVKQTIFFIDYERSQYATLKMKPTAGTEETLAAVEKIYTKYDPVNVFDYRFLDEMHEQKFGEEQRIGRLAGFFTILAIFISCLGLFGMAAYVAERRSREIGIRKVLGATIYSIVQLISAHFLKLVIVALVIATPIAYWLMQNWLEDYVYRIELSWWMFALAGGLATGIALLTVGLQSLRAAVANPLDAIRKD